MSLLDRLFRNAHESDSAELHNAITWAVDRIEPLLKHVGGFPDRYRKPIANALEYARTLADKIPGPVSITPEAYASDPLVRTMFALPDDLHSAMGASRAMQSFLLEHPGTTKVYALICMRRKVKDLFGMELQGDILRRDVRQEAVFFTDYTIAEPGLTETESRAAIARGFFESLVFHVANRIDARKLERANLEVERDRLLTELRSAPAEQRGEMRARLDEVLSRLGGVIDSLDLVHYFRDFEAVMHEPEKHLYLVRTEMNLDSMGIVRQPTSSDSDEIVFCDLIGRDRRRWTVVMMYCDHVEGGASIAERIEKAERWLGL